MFAASTYEEIERIEQTIENQEIVVFLFVRPTTDDALDIIKEFEYIHYNSGKFCSIYAIGYTNDFDKANDKSYRKIDVDNNREWYFSTEAFVDFKRKLEDRINWRYSGETELLILQNNPEKKNVLNLSNYVAIDVNKGIREGYIDSFQRFMESLVRSSESKVSAKETMRDIVFHRISVKDILSETIDNCKKLPIPVRKILKDKLFYRCSVCISK